MNCKHCGRTIVNEGGGWIDPEATGDDSVWRETCEAHDTFTAEHEPTDTAQEQVPWHRCPRDGAKVHTGLDGIYNEDGTGHVHCDLCDGEVIGISSRQAETMTPNSPFGAFIHAGSTDCPGSWHYDAEGRPMWGERVPDGT